MRSAFDWHDLSRNGVACNDHSIVRCTHRSALRWLFPSFLGGYVQVGRYLAHDPTTIAADVGVHPESWTQECDAEAFENALSAVNAFL